MAIKKKWIAGFFILILSWCTYQGYENLFFYRIPVHIKHLINFSLLLLIFLSGYYAFKKESDKWIILIWISIYAFIIFLMGFIGVLDLFYRFRISNFREMIHNLRMFFSSPVPYGILLFLEKKVNKQKNIAAK